MMLQYWLFVVAGGLSTGIAMFGAYDRRPVLLLVSFVVAWASAYNVWRIDRVWVADDMHHRKVGVF